MTSRRVREYSCGVELTLQYIGGKWKPIILAHLKEGALRYGELRERIPALSDKMLTQRLAELVDQGLVRKRKDGGRGARSSYELTALAQSLKSALTALNDWGMRMARETGAVVRPRW
jgi:DNA-binding HxlR family transcriptional regulator